MPQGWFVTSRRIERARRQPPELPGDRQRVLQLLAGPDLAQRDPKGKKEEVSDLKTPLSEFTLCPMLGSGAEKPSAVPKPHAVEADTRQKDGTELRQGKASQELRG